MTSKPGYLSYMLRLKLTQSDDRPAWVASLQSTNTGEVRWFSDIEALLQFLKDAIGRDGGTNASILLDTQQTEIALPEIAHQIAGNRSRDGNLPE